MQPSDTAKDVPAKRNRLLGIKSRLNEDSDHAGSMEEKTKNEQGTFLIIIIYLQAGEERYVAQ